MTKKTELLLLTLGGLLLLSAPGFAGVRHFTYLYEAPTSAPGTVELENTVTFETTENERFSAVDFRHEFEVGMTDHLQLSLYVADWDYHSEHPSGFTYTGTAVEAIYNLTNPVIDLVGMSVYEEIKVGFQFLESESKLIAQKNFGPLILAYNATLEAEFAGENLEEQTGEFQHGLGASYEITPRCSVGIEMLHELVFPDWSNRELAQNFFVGPNVSYRQGRWFTTVTALAQATHTADEPDWQVRTIVGYAF